MDPYKKAIHTFQRLYRRVLKSNAKEPTAMTLATAGASGQPSIRTVLLKQADKDGFVFYTNTQSRKGRQLKTNAKAALCFYWPMLGRQVLVEGRVRPVSSREADAYWKTRARQSQIGAWASLQSSKLTSRFVLLERAFHFAKKFHSKPVPRPPHWSGYRVMPSRLEFWKAGKFRLHDRFVVEKRKGRWTQVRLYP